MNIERKTRRKNGKRVKTRPRGQDARRHAPSSRGDRAVRGPGDRPLRRRARQQRESTVDGRLLPAAPEETDAVHGVGRYALHRRKTAPAVGSGTDERGADRLQAVPDKLRSERIDGERGHNVGKQPYVVHRQARPEAASVEGAEEDIYRERDQGGRIQAARRHRGGFGKHAAVRRPLHAGMHRDKGV